MAAPFFCSPVCLAADLSTLGYPNASENQSILSSGEGRLRTLEWLASVIDPTFEATDDESHVSFWDDLGLQAAPLNSAGFRVPFTADPERVRDRSAANLFMRTAIDLAMAAQRRRSTYSTDELAVSFEESCKTLESRPLLSEEDLAANAQLDLLINQRHVLFPHTLGILQEQPTKKRRPLAQKKLSTNSRARPGRAMASTMGKKPIKNECANGKGGLQSREDILEHLRSMQRQALDNTSGKSELGEGGANVVVQSLEGEAAVVEDSSITELAETATSLTELVQKFQLYSSEALGFREARSNLAQRDVKADEKISEVSSECRVLGSNVQESLRTIESIQNSVHRLTQGRQMLEALPASVGVKSVAERSKDTALL